MSHTDVRLLDLKHEELSLKRNISRERELSSKLSPLVGVLISAKFWSPVRLQFEPWLHHF